MNKAQQMRWTRRGADRLLQVRCAVYNGTLGTGFGQRFQAANDPAPASGHRGLTPNLATVPLGSGRPKHAAGVRLRDTPSDAAALETFPPLASSALRAREHCSSERGCAVTAVALRHSGLLARRNGAAQLLLVETRLHSV